MGILLIVVIGALSGMPTAYLLRDEGGFWRTIAALLVGLIAGVGIAFLGGLVLLGQLRPLDLGIIGAVLGPIGGAAAAARMRAPLTERRPPMSLR